MFRPRVNRGAAATDRMGPVKIIFYNNEHNIGTFTAFRAAPTLRSELRNISLRGCGTARWQSLELILKVVSIHCMATVETGSCWWERNWEIFRQQLNNRSESWQCDFWWVRAWLHTQNERFKLSCSSGMKHATAHTAHHALSWWNLLLFILSAPRQSTQTICM